MKQLCIDTSTSTCVVGLKINEQCYAETQVGFKRHAMVVLDFVDRLLHQQNCQIADLDNIILGKGPGSFTGLRIAATVVQGLAESHQIPVIAISSLAAIAQGVFRNTGHEQVCVVQDARMNEVYYGKYFLKNNKMLASEQESVVALSKIDLCDDRFVYVGSGLTDDNDATNDLYPAAEDLFDLAFDLPGQDAMMALPSYVRNQVAATPNNLK